MKVDLEIYQPIQLSAKNMSVERAESLLEWVLDKCKANNETCVYVAFYSGTGIRIDFKRKGGSDGN